MEAHEELIRWAQKKGVKLNGIYPKAIPGRGIGLVATRKIKPKENILEVPVSALRRYDTVPKSISRKLPRDTTVHGLLAADLALDTSGKYAAWNAVVPTPADLASIPLNWPAGLQEYLPAQARELLAAQQAKYATDHAAFAAAFAAAAAAAAVDEPAYRHAWLLVNTRTFYFTTARTERAFARADRMVLQPVADLFNHVDAGGCDVSFDAGSFVVAPTRAYAAGDEVHISYGAHANDFLLVEYGFALAPNRWDEVRLDDALVPLLPPAARAALDAAGFLGRYVLDAAAVCHRTQVAARLLCGGVPPPRWRAFVDGRDDGEPDQARVDAFLARLLEGYARTVQDTVLQVGALELDAVGRAQRHVLLERWDQVLVLVNSAIERLKT